MYAPLVVSCTSEYVSHVPDASVFHALKKYKSPLFPNLRVLNWHPFDYSQSALDLFLSPNLIMFASTKACPAMLTSLRPTCIRLRRLSLYKGYTKNPDEPALTLSFSDLVMHLPDLESIISSIQLTANAIVHLSTAPNLQELNVPNDAAELVCALGTNLRHPVFSSIAILVVNAQDLSSVITFLSLCHLRNLQELVLTAQHKQVHAVEQFFVQLHNSCSPDVLESLYLQLRPNPFNGSIISFSFPAHILKPLLVFRRLQNLSLWLMSDLDDDALEQMAASWPGLVRFDLGSPGGRPKTTLRGLVSLAKHCHSLRTVTVALHISSRDLAYPRKDMEPNHSLKHLDLAKSWIDDDVDLARAIHFLRTLFPSLGYIAANLQGSKSEMQMAIWEGIHRA